MPERGHPQHGGKLRQTERLRRRGRVRAHRAHRQCRRRELHQHYVPQAARDPRLPLPVPRQGPALAVHHVPEPGRHPGLRADAQLRPRHLRDERSQCKHLSLMSVFFSHEVPLIICLMPLKNSLISGYWFGFSNEH